MERILATIEATSHQPELRLPSEHGLAKELGMSRSLVQKAYARLEDLGYLYGKQGIGHFTAQKKIGLEVSLNSGKGFSAEIKAQGWQVHSELLSLHTRVADRAWAQRLGLVETDLVYELRRSRRVEGLVVATHTSYLSQAKFAHLENFVATESLFAALKNYHIEGLRCGDFLLDITLATEEDAKVFNCPRQVPLVNLKGVNYDIASLSPIEYYEAKYRSDMFKFRFG